MLLASLRMTRTPLPKSRSMPKPFCCAMELKFGRLRRSEQGPQSRLAPSSRMPWRELVLGAVETLTPQSTLPGPKSVMYRRWRSRDDLRRAPCESAVLRR
jgi:hypothetical protein